MKEIPLTEGLVTIVDNEDYDYLTLWNWGAKADGNTFYAIRKSPRTNGKQITILMHREILKLTFLDGRLVDHRDRNGLHNWRDNLRESTYTLNAYNRKIRTDNKSGYRGVHWRAQEKRWVASLRHKEIGNYCAYFKTIIEAAKAYDAKAIEWFGENALLNFPIERST